MKFPNLFFLSALAFAILSSAAPLHAESRTGESVTQELQAISAKLDELSREKKTILENDAKILNEIHTVQIRAHRRPRHLQP